MFSLIGDLDERQREEMRRIQRDAELRGEGPFGLVAEAISLRNLRRVATTASIDMLRRATQVVYMIGTYQSIVVMVGVLDIEGREAISGTSTASTARWSVRCRPNPCGRKPAR